MNITIRNVESISDVDFMGLVKIFHPDIKHENNKMPDHKRLVKYLIRDKSPVLISKLISMELDIPIYLMYECKNVLGLSNFIDMQNFNIDQIMLEADERYTDSENVAQISLLKKLKSLLKDSGIVNFDRIKAFLPMSTIIRNKLVLNYFDMFRFLSFTAKNMDKPKIRELKTLIFSKLFEIDPLFFTSQNVEIFIANEGNY